MPTPETPTQADVLAAARALLHEHGWIKDEAQTSQGFCLVGATNHVLYLAHVALANAPTPPLNKWPWRLLGAGQSKTPTLWRRDTEVAIWKAMAQVASEQFPDRFHHSVEVIASEESCVFCQIAVGDLVTPWSIVAVFNDHPETTLADVELVLEKAIARLEEA